MTSSKLYLSELHNTIFSEEDVLGYFEEYDDEVALQAVIAYQDCISDVLIPDDSPPEPMRDFGAPNPSVLDSDWPKLFNELAPLVSGSQGLRALASEDWVLNNIRPALIEALDGDEELATDAIEFHDYIVRREEESDLSVEAFGTVCPGFHTTDTIGVLCLKDQSPSSTATLHYSYTPDGITLSYRESENEELGLLHHELTLVLPYDDGNVYSTAVSSRLHNPIQSEILRKSYQKPVPTGNSILYPSVLLQMAVNICDEQQKEVEKKLVCDRCGERQNESHGRFVLSPQEQPTHSRKNSERPLMIGQMICTECLVDFCESTMGLSTRQAQNYIYCVVLDYSNGKAAEYVTRSENDGETPKDERVPEGSMKSAGSRLRNKRKQAKTILSVIGEDTHI